MALFRRRRRVEVRVESGKRLIVQGDEREHVFEAGDVLPAWLLERAAELVAAGRLTFEEVS